MNRDAIDFGRTKIPQLFVKLFIPTLMGLLFWALTTVADGIFVGQGVGSDGLAAINIVAPLFQIAMGIALMFGTGASIVAAIHLSHDNVKAARINSTQALVVGTLAMVAVAVLCYAFPRGVGFLFGGSERLMPYIIDYLLWVLPALVCSIVSTVGLFVIRLDGSPKYAMVANVTGALLNIVLDWVAVFPLGMGLKGAALATSVSCLVSALIAIYYLLFMSHKLSLYRLKLTMTSLRLTMRNVGYMVRMGFSTFIGETAMSCMMIVGNYMFIDMLKEDGVAAYSVACYMFPLVFMFGSAIAQSAQPIISYNHGLGQHHRISSTFRLSLRLAAVCGLVMMLAGIVLCRPLMSLFLDSHVPAFSIAVDGFPLFATSFLFFSLNMVLIGYYQALERARKATLFMSLRGYLFIIPVFILLPRLVGVPGLWLAVPVSEAMTFFVIVLMWLRDRK